MMEAVVTGRRIAAAILCGALTLTACATATPLTRPSWLAPPDPMALAEQAGVETTEVEHVTTHTHAHLDVMVDGERVTIPAGIGIDIEAPVGIDIQPTDDGTATQYFVTQCDAPCLSALHTHDPGGIIHTESQNANQEPFTLGQFFTEWGVRLDDSCVGEFCKPGTRVEVYLDDQRYNGNPADIELETHLEIAIIIGTPPDRIPDSFPFGDNP